MFSFSQSPKAYCTYRAVAVAEAAGLFAEAASAQERVRLALEGQDRGASRVGWIAPRSLPAIWQVSFNFFLSKKLPNFFGN